MQSFSLNIRGHIREFSTPQVMGILNVTPDSFYAGSRTIGGEADRVDAMARQLVDEGADIIDIGGCSTRPGSETAAAAEEMRRVASGIEAVRRVSADIIISVDTFRASVARQAVALGADIVNDISAGTMDPGMIPAVAAMGVPYIMMHTRGNPDNMLTLTDYPLGVCAGVVSELQPQIVKATFEGIADIIVDPGFGFAKTPEQNYELMAGLPEVGRLLGDRPMLVGVSRKSMIYRPLGITPAEALPGTTVLNALALERGAAILRVHDVAACRQAVDVMRLFARNSSAAN